LLAATDSTRLSLDEGHILHSTVPNNNARGASRRGLKKGRRWHETRGSGRLEDTPKKRETKTAAQEIDNWWGGNCEAKLGPNFHVPLAKKP
jgi:hypothetical protein